MPYTFHIAARFDASYSLLGRWMRRRSGDERRAEALFIFALAGVVLGLVLVHYVTGLLLPSASAHPGVLRAVWLGQGVLWLVALATCAAGVRPAITVRGTHDGLEVVQGRRVLSLRRRDIREVSVISALRYHRHYRRYAGTRSFVNRMEPELLLIHVPDGHVVLGLAPAERDTVREHLAGRLELHPYAAARA